MDPVHTRRPRPSRLAAAVAGTATVVCIAACGGTGGAADDTPATSATISATRSATRSSGTRAPAPTASGTDQQFPDVLAAELTASGDTWSIAATISSPYDTAARHADAFRVLAPDGSELGVRELAHDHAAEQPFTRSLADVSIPDDVDEVTVEGRDRDNGWGGDTVSVRVPR